MRQHSTRAIVCRTLIFIFGVSSYDYTERGDRQRKSRLSSKGHTKRCLPSLVTLAAEYEDKAAMLNQAKRILAEFDPTKTIVNIGATLDGIGAVYEEAKHQGFVTTGIVSTQAREAKATLSPYVDHVFYVKDTTWGGLMQGSEQLSPTSTAIVTYSDVVIGIGGGEFARDEMLVAKRLGKDVRFIPSDMSHQRAIEKAEKRAQLAPTEFRGAAHAVFSSNVVGK